MSFRALAAAAVFPVATAAEKLILLAYADRHDERSGCAWPSIAWLCGFSRLDRKTVIATVARLEAGGALVDSGRRAGNTRQIKVYRLALAALAETVPESEPSRIRNGSVFPPEESRKRDSDSVREPVPSKTASSSEKPVRGVARGAWHRLPPDWTPSRPLPPLLAERIARWPPGKIADELEALHCWAANASDQAGRGRKLDWDKAWINWLKRVDEDWRIRHGNRTDTTGDGIGPTTRAALDFLRDGDAA